jgi:hypothetical protein
MVSRIMDSKKKIRDVFINQDQVSARAHFLGSFLLGQYPFSTYIRWFYSYQGLAYR